MSTTEDIEIAKQANAAVIARESGATGDSYGVPSADLSFDTPMVIEGQLPNLVPVAEAEGVVPADSFTGPADPFNQSWVDFRVRQVTGPDPVGAGPTSQEPGPFDPAPISYEVGAFDPIVVPDPEDRALSDTDGPGPTFESTAKSPYGGGVARDPEASAEAAKTLETKKKAAKALAVLKLTKEVFDNLSPEEQESEVLKLVGTEDILEGVGEAAGIETTEGLTPAAIGTGEQDTGVPSAQSLSAKAVQSPQQRLAQLAVDKRRIELESINQEMVSTERAVARSRVLEGEAEDDKEAKISQSDKAFEELKSAMDSVGDFKVDRGRFWANKSTGLKIATAISLMLSAYAHAKSGRGGVDPALKMMMQAVENDISDQVKNYNSRVAGLGRKQSLYGLFRQRGLDSQQAEKAATMKAFSELRMDLGRQKLKTNSQMAKIQLAEAELKLEQAEKGLLNGFAPQNFNEYMRGQEFLQSKKDKLQLRTSNVVRGGVRLLARDKTEATRGDKIEGTANKGIKAFQDMRNLINQMQPEDLYNPWSSLRLKIDTQRAIMFKSYKDVVSPGTIMSDEDALRVAKIDRDPTKINLSNFSDVLGFTRFSLTALDDFERSLKSHRDTDLRVIFKNYPTPKRIEKRNIFNTGPVKPRGRK